MDFTLKIYENLLGTLKSASYGFYRLDEYLGVQPQNTKFVIMRHDVDRRPGNALKTAELENRLDIKASYYFRIVKKSFQPDIIKKIADLGHEIGYHYEDLTLAQGDMEKAVNMFEKNLEQVRKIAPVTTICMHGSPFTRWDNRKIWEQLNYKNYGITGEPYHDLDFSQILYLTDTGRRWNGQNMSIRDRVNSGFDFNIKTTFDLINAVEKNIFPQKLMFNVHPERWDNSFVPWLRQLVLQNTKNIVKKIIVKKKL